MADVSITPANVVPGADAQPLNGISGETITAGMAVYLKSSDGRYWKSQMDGTAAEAAIAGIATTGSSAGQNVVVQIGGTLTIGGTVVAGTVYIVSATAGGICPVADIASTNYLSIVGYATTAAIIVVTKQATGVVHA
jgi:predicted transcriptional regulator